MSLQSSHTENWGSRKSVLGKGLEAIYLKYHRPEFLGSDPLAFVHGYFSDPDREWVGLLAALLAYGRVSQIQTSLNRLKNIWVETGKSPHQWAMSLSDKKLEKNARRKLQGWVHRFQTAQDIILLAALYRWTVSEYGSLGNFALKCGFDIDSHEDAGTVLSKWILCWNQIQSEKFSQIKGGPGFYFLLSDPARGSSCKRWMMFFRWMVREDGIDLGVWKKLGVTESKLLMPLDTHTGSLGRMLGMTERKSNDWKSVVAITQKMKEFLPHDPVRYDFSLCRIGILGRCQKKFIPEVCNQCPLQPSCRVGRSPNVKASFGTSRALQNSVIVGGLNVNN